jgi:hypothetical protein
MSQKLHIAPYGVRPVPDEGHHACVYQVHNIDTGNNIGTPFPMDARQDAFKLARDLNEEWKIRLDAVKEHHDQKADDRCIEDDTKLYAAFGLPPADHRVGDKAAMLENCALFIERRCESGGWSSYVELEARIVELQDQIEQSAALPLYITIQLPRGRKNDHTEFTPGAFDGARFVNIPVDQIELGTAVQIIESHREGETLVIDKARLMEVSICPAPAQSEDSPDART